MDADFDSAREELRRVVEDPALTADDALEAHRLLAALSFLRGDVDGAREHALAATALDPATTPPAGSPPELDSIFDRARTDGGGSTAQLRIEPDHPLAPGQSDIVRATLAPAPERLFGVVRLRCVSASTVAADEGPPPEVTVTVEAASDSVHCSAVALSPFGAELRSERRTFRLAAAPAAALEAGAEEPAAREEHRALWPWVLAGTVAVAAVALVVVLVVSASPTQASFGEGTRVDGW